MTRPHVHVIPVPAGMTPEQAWQEICVMGKLVDGIGRVNEEGTLGSWATVDCDGEECKYIEGDLGQFTEEEIR